MSDTRYCINFKMPNSLQHLDSFQRADILILCLEHALEATTETRVRGSWQRGPDHQTRLKAAHWIRDFFGCTTFDELRELAK